MRKGTKKLNFFLPIIVIVVVAIFSFLNGSKSMDLDFGDDVLTVQSPEEFSFSVAYDEIGSLDLVELSDPGTMLSGDENSSFSWGVWENEAWGQYSRCTSEQADTAILITTLDDAHLVISIEGDETTSALFDAFNKLLADRENEAAA